MPEGEAKCQDCRRADQRLRCERTCTHCGEIFYVRKSTSLTRFCSRACFGASRQGVARGETTYVKVRPCAVCGADVRGPGRTPLCSRECADVRRAEREAPRWRDKCRRRRALKTGAAAERYTTEEIAERDAYMCQLCSYPVVMWAPSMSRWAPTVDHIKPLVLGGDDTKVNVQLAHRFCNTSKGAVLVEDLPLGDQNSFYMAMQDKAAALFMAA